MSDASVSAIEAAIERFARERPEYEAAARDLSLELQSVTDAAAIRTHIDHRAKDIRSFHKKIIDKRYADPWKDVTDKAGVRVIVETPEDVDRVAAALRSAMPERILSTEDKRSLASPDRLGYSGLHLQLRLPPAGSGDDGRECEIQIRTAAQDLWSTMSHRWLYKPIVELSAGLQHAAFRLAALTEIFDEEVQRLAIQERDGSNEPSLRLVLMAEEAYLAIAHSPSDREFSRLIVPQLLTAFTAKELGSYGELLDAWLQSEKATLQQIYDDYGPHGPAAYLPQYVLFGQAESILVLERLSTCPHRLAETWRATDLPWSYLVALADAIGVALPDR